jgi:hypothetical protein
MALNMVFGFGRTQPRPAQTGTFCAAAGFLTRLAHFQNMRCRVCGFPVVEIGRILGIGGPLASDIIYF